MNNAEAMNTGEAAQGRVALCSLCKTNPVRSYKIGSEVVSGKICEDCDRAAEKQKSEAEYQKRLARQQAAAERNISQMVPSRFTKATVNDMDIPVKNIVENLPYERGLFVGGLPGRGKSHLLFALVKKNFKAGYGVIYWSWEELLTQLRSVSRQKNGISKIIGELVCCDILALDDVGGKEKIGRFEMTILFMILDGRTANNRPTYLASNRAPEEFRLLYDGRIYSRIMGDCELVEIIGPDRRLNWKTSLFDGEVKHG